MVQYNNFNHSNQDEEVDDTKYYYRFILSLYTHSF